LFVFYVKMSVSEVDSICGTAEGFVLRFKIMFFWYFKSHFSKVIFVSFTFSILKYFLWTREYCGTCTTKINGFWVHLSTLLIAVQLHVKKDNLNHLNFFYHCFCFCCELANSSIYFVLKVIHHSFICLKQPSLAVLNHLWRN